MHLSLSSVGRLFSLVVIVAAAILLLVCLFINDSRPSTNDAYLQADLVRMAPEVSGRIVALPIRDNQAVKKGDLLFAIDPEPYRLRLEQARAQVQGLEANIKVQTDQVASQGARAKAAETGIGSAQAQLELALSTLARLEPLGRQGFVPKEQVDQARTAMMVARNAVAQSNQQAQETRQAVTSTAPLEAQLSSAKALAALAERDLRLTEVRAAFDERDVFQLTQHGGVFVATHLLDQRELVADDRRHVEALHVQLQARNRVMASRVQHLGGPQQRLRRHATDIDAGAAQRQARVHERRTRTEIVRLDRGAKAAGAAADDDEIVVLHGAPHSDARADNWGIRWASDSG